MGSGSVGAVAAQLQSIDRNKLSESDQRLLDAAQAVVGEVIAPPAAPAAASAEPRQPSGTAGPPPVSKAAAPPSPGKPAGADAAALAASMKTVSDTRRKLAAIDELIKETE
jgi:chemotaxis protein MotC